MTTSSSVPSNNEQIKQNQGLHTTCRQQPATEKDEKAEKAEQVEKAENAEKAEVEDLFG